MHFEKVIESMGLKERSGKLDNGIDTLVYSVFDDARLALFCRWGRKICHCMGDEFFAKKCSRYIPNRMAVTKFSDHTLIYRMDRTGWKLRNATCPISLQRLVQCIGKAL